MIDDPVKTDRLLAQLKSALPIAARVTPELTALVRSKNAKIKAGPSCRVTSVSYAGDEGGILCRLEFDADDENGVFASITHLRFDPRLPLTREIIAYQKHRVKKLRR